MSAPRPGAAPPPRSWRQALARIFCVVGPGIMVMLADTDAGSVITAAQSGAQWGYRLVLPQIVLVPVLYLVQEVTVRLGIVTRQGHGELIREHFGPGWAALSVGTLFLSSVGALVTEFSGIAGVGALFGVPAWLTVSVATVLLILLGVTGSYRRIERIGIAVGMLELFFIPAALMSHPDPAQILRGLASFPLGHRDYMFLLAANVGAVVMPWMIFYQQGAVVDKRLAVPSVRLARWDVLAGAVLTQVVMIAVVMAVAGTIGQGASSRPLDSVQQISRALTPFIGPLGGKVVFGLGMLGASFVAALVVSIAGAYGIGEALGFNHSLNSRWREARTFYSVYTLAHVGGAAVVILSVAELVKIDIDVEVMNAMLLPIVLGFLLVLESRALPAPWRMRGGYRTTVWLLSGIVMAFGVYTAITAL